MQADLAMRERKKKHRPLIKGKPSRQRQKQVYSHNTDVLVAASLLEFSRFGRQRNQVVIAIGWPWSTDALAMHSGKMMQLLSHLGHPR